MHNKYFFTSTRVRGVEEIVAVRTFRSRLPVRRVRHMDRRGQEVQNNFLTDHIIKFLSGSPVRSPKGRQKRSERPSADRFQAVSDTIARDRRLFPSYGHFSPTDRSTCTPRRGKQTTQAQIASSIHSSLSMVCRISSMMKRSVAIATIMVSGGRRRCRCRRP